MENLVNKIKNLQKDPISKVIKSRLKEFKEVSDLFSELCFCLMTANFKAEKSIEIQRFLEGENAFLEWEQDLLAMKLKEMGHRFWPQRAERIVLARSLIKEIEKIRETDPVRAREFLVKNVKGLGLKESSHFLRNVGFEDLAIIDFHIVDLLFSEGLIKEGREKAMSPKRYHEIEEVLKKLGEEVGMNLAELDLYLWYLETGKVLK